MAGALLLCLVAAAVRGETGPLAADPAVRLSSAAYASELWNFTARFDGGYRLFTWFFITNEGPGEHTAAALWYLVHPNGRVAEYWNGRQEGRWRLSPDRLRIDVASSSLDLHRPLRRVAIDSTSQQVKIDLQFPAAAGPREAAVSSAAALRTDTLQIATPVAGTIWEGGMTAPLPVQGTASLTHAWMEESVPEVVRRRIEFFADQPGLAVYLSDVAMPSGEHLRWFALERGAQRHQSAGFEMTLERAGAVARDRNYPIPGSVVIRDDGVRLDIRPERTVLRADPLDLVPQPFRFLFGLRIAPQWTWMDASFRLQLAPERGGGHEHAAELAGRGLLAVNFVNPLPLP